MSFNAKGEIGGGFDINNMVIFPNRSFQRVKVGSVSEGKGFIIHKAMIIWPRGFNQVQTEFPPILDWIISSKTPLFVQPYASISVMKSGN